MTRMYACIIVLALADPGVAQTNVRLPTTDSPMLRLSSGDAEWSAGTFSIVLGTRSSERQVELPASIAFASGVDAPIVRQTTVTLSSLVGSRLDRDKWRVDLPQAATVSVASVLVKGSSFSLTVTPHTTLTAGNSAQTGEMIGAWLSHGTQELSVSGTLEHADPNYLARSVYARYGNEVNPRLRGEADISYSIDQSGYWIAATETMMYNLTPNVQIDLVVRHEAMDAAVQSSVDVGLTVRIGG